MKITFFISLLAIISCEQINSTKCKLELYQSWNGLNIKIISKELMPKKARIIYPKQIVTMDFVEDRINFYVNEKSIIKSISCG